MLRTQSKKATSECWVFPLFLPGLGAGPSTALPACISAQGVRTEGAGARAWVSCGLEGKNEMARWGLQELRRRKGEVGCAGSRSRGLGS